MNTSAVKSGIDDIAARLKQNGTSSSTKSNGTFSANTDPTTISNHTPSMNLSCVECGVCKSNSEDMEIHIKTEHLNWLPFQCPMCLTERASDSQMREHLHSSHQKNMNKFIYVDNVIAKRKLQVLMDKAFSLNVTKRVNASSSNPTSSTSTSPYSPNGNYRGFTSTPSSGRNTSSSNGSSVVSTSQAAQAAASAIVNLHKEKEKQHAQNTVDLLKLLDFSAAGNPEIIDPKPASSKSSSSRKRPYVPTSATESITTMDLGPTNVDFLATLNSFTHAQTPENEENDQRKWLILSFLSDYRYLS